VTVIATLAGYAMSRFTFRGKGWIVALMLLTQMFPLVMVMPPIFACCRSSASPTA
jgi:multiple sugar transport system permease protein